MNPFAPNSHSYQPPPDFDEPPAYSYGDSTYMSEGDSPRHATGATMRLLPTSVDADESGLGRESEDLGYVAVFYLYRLEYRGFWHSSRCPVAIKWIDKLDLCYRSIIHFYTLTATWLPKGIEELTYATEPSAQVNQDTILIHGRHRVWGTFPTFPHLLTIHIPPGLRRQLARTVHLARGVRRDHGLQRVHRTGHDLQLLLR